MFYLNQGLKYFDLIPTNLWGPTPVKSITGSCYFKLFIDDHTRFTWIYFLTAKDEAYSTFVKFHIMIHTQFQPKIKKVQLGWGGEYRSMSKLFDNLGILCQILCSNTPQQNGRVERKNKHVVEIGLSLLAQSSMPIPYWPYAFQIATYLINRLPSSLLHYKSPYHLLYFKSSSYSHLNIFYCACFPFLRHYNNNKLQFKSRECVFLKYNSTHKGYICLDPHSNKIHISIHVIFNEVLSISCPLVLPTSP